MGWWCPISPLGPIPPLGAIFPLGAIIPTVRRRRRRRRRRVRVWRVIAVGRSTRWRGRARKRL